MIGFGRHRVRWATALVVALLILPGGASAQGPRGGLAEAERLIEEGRFSSARLTLSDWLENGWGEASRNDRQTGVWLRALLSLEPSDAELDYRRLVIEYPGGTYSDRALIRLAQASQARGNVADARQYMADFLRDYPQSPLRVEARSLIAKLGEGEPEVPEPIPGPAGDGAVGDRGTQEAGSSSGPFTLQLGAYSTERRALALLLEARAAELEPRLVRVAGSALLRVRLGEFATREEAEAGAAALTERGFQAVVSSDRGREEPVR